MTSDPGLASWLQLTLTPGLGAASIRGLLKQFGLPENVLAARPDEPARLASAAAAARGERAHRAGAASAAPLQALDSDAVAKSIERALAWLEQPGHALVTLADAA